MPFLDHLEEFRRRILWILAALVIGSSVFACVSGAVLWAGVVGLDLRVALLLGHGGPGHGRERGTEHGRVFVRFRVDVGAHEPGRDRGERMRQQEDLLRERQPADRLRDHERGDLERRDGEDRLGGGGLVELELGAGDPADPPGQLGGRLPDRGHVRGAQRDRRPRARPVPGVGAGLLDVLHHAADHDLAHVVTQRVHVDLGGVLQEPVDEHGPGGRQAALLAQAAEVGQLGHGGPQAVVVGPACEGRALRPRGSRRPRSRRRGSPCRTAAPRNRAGPPRALSSCH